MNFAATDLFIWLAVAAAIVAGINQALDLFHKLFDSKADRPAAADEHLVTVASLTAALAPLTSKAAELEADLRRAGETFVTKEELQPRMDGLSGKVDRTRVELGMAIRESQAAGESRVQRLETRMEHMDQARIDDTKTILREIGALVAGKVDKK